MSHFYASIQGNRSERTCCGTKNSGIRGHIRGWDVGVKVIGKHDQDADSFEIYATKGSNDSTSIHLGTVRSSETDGSLQFEAAT